MRKSTSDALLNAGTQLKKEAVSFLKTRSGKAACGGALAGGYLGSSIGIAALGTAINGAWVLAPVMAGVCWYGAKLRKRKQA